MAYGFITLGPHLALVQEQLGISVAILRLTSAKKCRVIKDQVPSLVSAHPADTCDRNRSFGSGP
jgi:hypothetical protein